MTGLKSGVASFGVSEGISELLSPTTFSMPGDESSSKDDKAILFQQETLLIASAVLGISQERSSKRAMQHASRQARCFTFTLTTIGPRPFLHHLLPILLAGSTRPGLM